MRGEPIPNLDKSRCVARTEARTHISDILGSSDDLSNNAPSEADGHAAHTEHCGSIRIAGGTLGDVPCAVKKNGRLAVAQRHSAAATILRYRAAPSSSDWTIEACLQDRINRGRAKAIPDFRA
jgi:hypothetical protein